VQRGAQWERAVGLRVSRLQGWPFGRETRCAGQLYLWRAWMTECCEKIIMSASEHDQAYFEALPDFLTWQAGTDLVRSACSLYLHWAYARLRGWSNEADSDLFPVTIGLPKSSQQRLLIAPESFHLLASMPGPEQTDRLRGFIRAEQHLCGQATEYPSGLWTALGDHYFPPTEPSALAECGESCWSTDQAFAAPTLGHIVLDAYSPQALADYPADVFGEASHHDAAEVEIVKTRIEESLDLIDSVSRTARLAVGASTQVISVARATPPPEGVGSVSIRTRIGRMGLTNLHRERATVCWISNAIVHESIHSLIYKLELGGNLYTDVGAAHQITAVSPWTGRTIRMHSFVHACFVWFGLWCFWNLAPAEYPEVAQFRAQAMKGFVSGCPLSGLSMEASATIQPRVCAAIREIHYRVASYGAP
jgi:hypothetical protein